MALPHAIQKRLILIIIVLLTALLGYWFFFVRNIESTDNAYLKGNMMILSPRVAGYLINVAVEDNTHVKAGTVIAKIEDTDYKARLQQAKAQREAIIARLKALENQKQAQKALIREAEATVKSAQANADRADKELTRSRTLIKDGAISRQLNDVAIADQKSAAAALDRAKAGLEAAMSQLNSLSAQVEEAEAQRKNAEATLTLAQFDLDNTEIKAARDGIIGNKTMQVGQLVRPGTALAYFVAENDIWIEANFKESQIAKMGPGQDVKIQIDAYPGMTFYGTVDSLSPASGSEFSLLPPENATGNFTKIIRRVPVKITFKEGTDLSLFKTGLSAYVSVKTR